MYPNCSIQLIERNHQHNVCRKEEQSPVSCVTPIWSGVSAHEHLEFANRKLGDGRLHRDGCLLGSPWYMNLLYCGGRIRTCTYRWICTCTCEAAIYRMQCCTVVVSVVYMYVCHFALQLSGGGDLTSMTESKSWAHCYLPRKGMYRHVRIWGCVCSASGM